MSFLTFWYKILYGLGFTPWEEDPTQGNAAGQITELFKREEKSQNPPYGPVLDLGSGKKIWK